VIYKLWSNYPCSFKGGDRPFSLSISNNLELRSHC